MGAADASAPSWLMDENVPGVGVKPDWFKAEKYKTVAAQAAAYTELEKKIGAPRDEPPAEYAINVPKEFVEKGVGIDAESALWKSVATIAREEKMSQAGIDRMVDAFIRSQDAEATASGAEMLQQMGAEGQKVVRDVAGWAKSNLDAEGFAWLDGMLKTDDDFFRFNALLQRHVLGRSQAARERSNIETPGGGDRAAEKSRLDGLMADPRYGNDPDYMKMVTAEFQRVYGTAPRPTGRTPA